MVIPSPSPALFVVRSNRGRPASLWVQLKGLHAGRPLRSPIPNSAEMTSNHPSAYAIAFAAYIAGAYRPHFRGSVIPFVVLQSVRVVLADYAARATLVPISQLESIELAQQLLDVQTRKLRNLTAFRNLLASRI